MSGENGLSNDDVAASGARRMPDPRLRDHDPDKKLNVEGALVCRVVWQAGMGAVRSGAGNVIKGKRAAAASEIEIEEEEE